MRSAVGGLLVLRSQQIIIIQSASKKKIRAEMPNTLLQIPLICSRFLHSQMLTASNTSFILNVSEAISHHPSVLACCQGEGTLRACFQDSGSDPRWHFCDPSLSARHGPPHRRAPARPSGWQQHTPISSRASSRSQQWSLRCVFSSHSSADMNI